MYEITFELYELAVKENLVRKPAPAWEVFQCTYRVKYPCGSSPQGLKLVLFSGFMIFRSVQFEEKKLIGFVNVSASRLPQILRERG